MSEKIKIYGVVGPTASGKTALAIELARRIDGEIICCDSMQIYKEMNIGTAKPTDEERAAVPHHMTDFLSPDKAYSCADYVRDAKAVDALITNFHLPESTLIMLVSAFYDKEKVMEAYHTAVNEEYRFFSFGDAMLIV